MGSAKSFTQREATAWRTFMEMQHVLLGRIEQQLLRDSSLSNADYTVLAVLSDAPDGRLRAVNLAQRLQWEKSRLHHQLSRMCKRGLVERLNGDGRTSYAVITADGRAALKAAAPAHRRHVRQMVFDQLTDEQVQQLNDISRAVIDGLDRGSAQ